MSNEDFSGTCAELKQVIALTKPCRTKETSSNIRSDTTIGLLVRLENNLEPVASLLSENELVYLRYIASAS